MCTHPLSLVPTCSPHFHSFGGDIKWVVPHVRLSTHAAALISETYFGHSAGDNLSTYCVASALCVGFSCLNLWTFCSFSITTTWNENLTGARYPCREGISLWINGNLKTQQTHCYPGQGPNSGTLTWVYFLNIGDEVKAVNFGYNQLLGLTDQRVMRSWFLVYMVQHFDVVPDSSYRWGDLSLHLPRRSIDGFDYGGSPLEGEGAL